MSREIPNQPQDTEVAKAARKGFQESGYPTQEDTSKERSYCGAMTAGEKYILHCSLSRGHEGKHSWED